MGCQKETIQGSYEYDRLLLGYRVVSVLDFNNDGTVIRSSSLEEVETQTGTYEMDGNEITIYISDWSDTFMRQGDVLVDTSGGRWIRQN